MNIALNVFNNKELFLTKNKFIFSKNNEHINSKFKPTYKSYLVEKENFAMSDNERAISYAYDDLGRLLAVNYFKEQTHNYEYDYRGYLIRDNNLRIEYDNNGNILKKGDVSYTYDSVIKDRLIKVGNETIEYDTSNPLIPTKYLDKRLKFEGKRLKEVTKNNKTSYFYYDEQGYLIKKIDGNNKVTNFVYENGNLLYLKKDNDDFNFLYDENNLLYGFILNKSDVYYYLRDIFNNILGILDNQGQIIVSYEYDAFGKIINIKDSSSIQLEILNPFKYKGYYYDEEIELYYLISRFYDASVGRFICSDNIEYLHAKKVNSLNLFAYCNNDPINFCDPSGRFAITLSSLLIGGLIAGLIGAAIGFGTAAYMDVKEDGVWFNGKIRDYVGRVAGGFVAGFGVGVCTVLGVGAGMAALEGTVATLVSSSGMILSFNSALGISSAIGFTSGAIGYAVRTGISESEEFKLKNMFVEGTFNSLSGMLSAIGGYLGGITGFHNLNVNSELAELLLRLLVENAFTISFKIINSIIKKYFMI